MRLQRRSLAVPACALALALGCGGGGDGGGQGADTTETAAAGQTEMPSDTLQARPDTTAQAVWAYVANAVYQDNWKTWPGKPEFYPGQQPHGAVLRTYLNPLAYDAVTNGATQMPVGATFVKENYTADTTLAAFTVMYKAAGYDPQHDDWFWLKRLPDGTVTDSGRVQSCIDCHGTHASNDYIMSASLGQ